MYGGFKGSFRNFAVLLITYLRIAYLDPKSRLQKTGEEKYPVKFSLFKNSLLESTSVCVFAHYETSPQISLLDEIYLKELRKMGFATLVVSTAEMTEVQIEKFVKDYSHEFDGLVVRSNLGFDFASWTVGINELRSSLPILNRLLLVNNSVFLISNELKNVISEIENEFDVAAIINSNEFRKHLMSFFLFFNNRAINTHTFRIFWNSILTNIELDKSKWTVIRKYELTWASIFAREKSLKIGSFFKVPHHFKRNPTTSWFLNLLLDQNFPLMKKSVFKNNYENLDLDNLIKKLDSVKLTSGQLQEIHKFIKK